VFEGQNREGRNMNHRIRVLVAGDIYPNRALVRPFLQDDGYEVVAEAYDRADVLPRVIRLQPDAVVIHESMLPARRGGKALDRIRRAAPEAKLVIVASDPAADRFASADATSEAGLSLAALSALLGRLFAQVPSGAVPRAGEAGAVVGAGGALVGASTNANGSSRNEPKGAAARFIATVGLPLVLVWALIALLTTGDSTIPPRADTTDLGANGAVVIPMPAGPIEGARDSLDRLVDAIEAGNPILATAHARALMDARTTALSLGYTTNGLDAQVRSRLAAVAGLLSPGLSASIAAILDGLFPKIGGGTPADAGSVAILAPTVGTGASGAILASGLGGQGSDATIRGVDGGKDGGGGRGDGDTAVGLGPGDGREWGQSHNASRTWGNGPPPWAKGNGPPPWANGHATADGGASTATSDHPGAHTHGHGYGHDKDHGHDR
jgi:CheY-like chemotaxis protein